MERRSRVWTKIASFFRQSIVQNEKLSILIEGSTNQSQLLNEKLSILIEGSTNQSQLLNEKLSILIEGSTNQSQLLNEKLSALIEGSTNQSQLLNEKLSALIESALIQSRILNNKFNTLEPALADQSAVLNELAMLKPLLELSRTQLATQTKQIEDIRAMFDVRAQQGLFSKEDTKASYSIAPEDVPPVEIDNAPRHEFTDIRNTLPRNSAIYVCHADHEHDRTYTENLMEYLESNGVPCKAVELSSSGQNTELQQRLEDQPAAFVGYNSQLDHAWLPPWGFMEAAAARQIPVIHWILDHPGNRWAEFQWSTRANSRFLFHSKFAEQYFHRYCMSGALTATMGGVGPHRRSRIEHLSSESFLRRPIGCLIALGLKRLRSVNDLREELKSHDADLLRIVNEAASRARFDLMQPLEMYLVQSLEESHLKVSNEVFNLCFHLTEASVQTFRRTRIFDIARRYPVLIQSDKTATPTIGDEANWEFNVGTQRTAARMPTCRAVLSVSHLNDQIHDRTMNSVNAGCVAIVEDNLAHRKVFQHGQNALLFRYDDDSLSRCLDVVCNEPLKAYAIAEAGFALRDDPSFRIGGFHNILKLAGQPVPPQRRPRTVVNLTNR